MSKYDSSSGSGAILTEREDNFEQSAPEKEERPLAALIQIARHKRLVSEIVGVAFLIGVAVSLLLPLQYESTTRIMTPQQTPSTAFLLNQLSGSGAAGLAASGGGGFGLLKNPNDIYVGLLSSRTIADFIIQEFDLEAAYRVENMTEARRALAKNSKIVSEKSGLIAISVRDVDKKRAAAIANAYQEQLRELTKTLAVTEASQRRLFYEEQLKGAKGDLISAEAAFQQVEQQKGMVQPDAQAKALIESTVLLHSRIAAKRVELEALRSYSTDSNPNVQIVENELSTLEAEGSRLEQGGHGSVSAIPGLQEVAGSGTEYLRAQHELQYRQILFDQLLKQYDAARIDEAKYAAVIQVVEQAVPADKKAGPRRILTVFLLTALGFLGAYVFLAVRNRVQNDADLAQSLAELRSAVFAARENRAAI